MNRHFTRSLSAIMVFGFALLPGIALSQQKSLKEQLVGAWTLVSIVNTSSSGTKRDLFGTNPKGLLIFDAGGRYVSVATKRDRTEFKSRNREKWTADEYKAAVLGTRAQFGTWSVNETSRVLIQQIEGSITPNNDGTEAKRSISFVGDELTLATTDVAREGSNVMIYRRAK
jgi:lipocalin-like protein